MRTTITRIALTLLAVLIGSTMLAASPGALAPGEVRYVVTLAAGAHTPDIAALGGRLEAIDGSVLTVVLPAQAAKALANDPAVQSLGEASPGPATRATATAPSHRLANDRFHVTPQDAITLWGSGEYVYDGAGNITAMGITGALNNDGKTSAFTYDLASRLKTASIGRASGGDIIEAYSYDGFGNLTVHQRTSPDSITYSPLPSLSNNRMTESGVTYDGGAGTGPGNVTAIGGQTLTYDAFNQVVTKSANGNNPPDYTYIYDVNEERIGAQHGSLTTHWTIRDFDNKPLIAFDSPPASGTQATWTWAESFAWADGKMLMAERPLVGQLHYHLDHLGSTRVITDVNGQLVAGSRVDYAPFGEEVTTPNAEVIKFTGHERDYDLSNPTADTYLDYMHARYYDSRRGRFLSVDPVLNAKSTLPNPELWNRYAYTANNPTGYTDPDGREHVQEPGFTKPLSEAKDWNEHPEVSWAFQIEGALLRVAAEEILGEAVGAILGVSAFEKGEAGKQMSIDAANGRGETVTGTEVSVRSDSGVKTRVDVTSRTAHGETKLIEAKNGPTARLSTNQKKALPEIQRTGACTPCGKNAAKAGLTPGVRITNVKVQVDFHNKKPK